MCSRSGKELDVERGVDQKMGEVGLAGLDRAHPAPPHPGPAAT